MAAARSLLDDGSFDSIGAKARGPAGRASGERHRRGVWAAALALTALVLWAWNLGILGTPGRSPSAAPTPAQQQQLDDRAKADQILLDSGAVSKGES